MSSATFMQAIEPAFPKVRPGIRAWTFFPATAKQDAAYVIGSEDCDRYIFVPGRRLDVVQMALKQLDGTRSADSVAAEILEERKVSMNVGDLCRKLDNAGLLTSSHLPRKQGDIDKLSIRLGNFNLSVLLRWGSRVARFVPGKFLAVLCGLLIISALAILAARFLGVVVRSPLHAPLTEIHFAWQLIAIVFVGLFIHESAHLLAASYAGLKEARGNFYLYAVVLPMVALKLRGFYTLSSRWRVVVWGAGVFANFSVASLALLLLQWGPPGWATILHNVIAVNWLMGITSLFPFLPTDGYFILATLLRQMNIRVRALAALGTLLNLRGARPTLLVALYAMANVLLLAKIIFNNVTRFISGALTHRPEIYVKALVILVGLVFVIRTIWKSGRSVETRSVSPATSSNISQPGGYP